MKYRRLTIKQAEKCIKLIENCDDETGNAWEEDFYDYITHKG